MPMKFLLPLVILAFPTAANAYLDPGTGSFIIQAVIAGIVGIGVAVKTYGYRIKHLFRHGKSANLDTENEKNKESQDS